MKPRVAVLGPPYSFTDLTFRKFLKSRFAPIYYQSISQIFEAVKNGKAEKGLVPMKNSVFGDIQETMNQLKKSKIKIHKKFKKKISFVFATLPPQTFKDIHTIMTNKIIFEQCKRFIKKYHLKKIFTKSSSAACVRLMKSKKRGVAVVASKEAIRNYGLKILQRNIEDERGQKTEFILFSS